MVIIKTVFILLNYHHHLSSCIPHCWAQASFTMGEIDLIYNSDQMGVYMGNHRQEIG